jgi:hypothetical protein
MSYKEMLDPKVFQRRPGWVATIRIKHLLTEDDDLTSEQINAIGKAIARHLKACTLFEGEDIIANFEGVTDLDEFNSILDDMYNVCDDARILVK